MRSSPCTPWWFVRQKGFPFRQFRAFVCSVARAFRALLARPGFTIVAVATLALGFGVNTAVFSLTRTVLLRPLPYRDGDRLVQVNQTFVGRPGLGAIAPAYY